MKSETNAVLFLLFLTKVLNTCFGETITLQSRVHLVCAMNNTESVIYVEPPIIHPAKNTTVLIEDDNIWEDWKLDNSLKIAQGPVLDKRWEDFESVYNNYLAFNPVSSLSFSIYSSLFTKIQFDVGQDYVYLREPKSRKTWIHYTVLFKNKTAHFYENGDIFFSEFFEELVIVTSNYTYWKIHEYSLRTASNISKKPTVLHIPSSLSCLTLYVLLHPHCILEVYISDRLNYTFCGKESEKIGDVWQKQVFVLEPVSKIALVRKTTNGKVEGFWGLDVRQCAKIKSGKVIYETTLNPPGRKNIRTCKSLLEQHETQGPMVIKPAELQVLNNCRGAGKLGENCSLQCGDLLGPTKEYCEGYRICEYFPDYSQCVCPWGFQGPSCDQYCADGRWGLNCQNKCQRGHPTCDKRNGNNMLRRFSRSSFKLVCSPGKYYFLVKADDDSLEMFGIFIDNSACFNITISKEQNVTCIFQSNESVPCLQDFNPTKISVLTNTTKLLEEDFILPRMEIIVCA